MSDEYTIILRGQRFTLTRDQIEADSPNYFTNCFLGEYKESQTREIKLGRSPALFPFIIEHLSGYEIVPLPDSAILPGMGRILMMKNLLVDASFYSLDALRSNIEGNMRISVVTTYELWAFSKSWPSTNALMRHYYQSKVIIDQSGAEPLINRFGLAQYPKLMHYSGAISEALGTNGRLAACWQEGDAIGLVVAK